MIVSYLGVTRNLVTRTVHLMAANIKAAKATLKHLLKLSTTVLRLLAKFTRHLLDLAKAF